MKNKRVLISILAIIFMILYTVVVYNFMFSPARMFNKALDKMVNKIDKNDLNLDFNKSMTDVNVKFNTDSEELSPFKDYMYGVNLGMDSEEKSAETKLYMIDKANKEYSYTGYIKNSNLYHKLSSFDKLILYNIEDQDLISLFEDTNSISTDDMKYLIHMVSKSVKKNLNKKNFSKSSSSLTINEKSIDVTKNTYKANSEEMRRLYKAIYNDLYNDSKSSKILSSLTGLTKEELKEEIDSINYTFEGNILVDVYSKFNTILGFDIYENDNKSFSYYTKDDDFIITNSIYTITGVKKDENLDVSVKVGNYEVASLLFSRYDLDDFAFDFKASPYTGKVNYKRDKSGKDYQAKLNVDINDGKNNYSFEVNANQNTNSKIADINVSEAQQLTDEEFQNVLVEFVTSLENTPFGYLGDLFMYDYDDVNYEYNF